MTGLQVSEEVGSKRSFAWAIDWPGWCRSGRDPELARASLVAYAARYAQVATAAGLSGPDIGGLTLDVVDRVDGGGGTDFGVPSVVTDADRRPVSATQAATIVDLVRAAWVALDEIAAITPPTLRKGPRGGGRDRDAMLEHCIEADHAYARELGIRMPGGSLDDRPAVEAVRASVLDVLGRPSDGGPLADRRWTARYAARRIAWHSLDHAWEMQDRTEPD